MSAQLTFARPGSYFHSYSGCGQVRIKEQDVHIFLHFFFMQTSSIMFFFSGWGEGALFYT